MKLNAELNTTEVWIGLNKIMTDAIIAIISLSLTIGFWIGVVFVKTKDNGGDMSEPFLILSIIFHIALVISTCYLIAGAVGPLVNQ